MANYKTHLNFSAIISLITSLIFYSLSLISLDEAVISFALGAIGGFLPDVDSSYSKSIKKALYILFFLVSIIVIKNTIHTHNLVDILIYIIAIYLIINYIILDLLRKISIHRGMFHSIPVAIILAMVVVLIANTFFNYNYTTSSYILGISFLIGYISHLLLDEIYSVDFQNKRIKKSFGSALKFGIFRSKKDKLHTFAIYIILIILFFMLPNINILEYIYYKVSFFRL